MSSRLIWCCVAACLLLHGAQAARREPDAAPAQPAVDPAEAAAQAALNGAETVEDPLLLEELQMAHARAGKPRLVYDNLPSSRPLVQPDRWNWYSANYSVFVGADAPVNGSFLGLQSVERRNLDAGVLNLTLEWKPLKNLTSEMMEWLFGNLHKDAVSPFDGETYPMYTLLHPVDHVKFVAEPADEPVAHGSTYTFMESPNSGCTYQPDSFDAPWACAPDRRGFTRPATPEDVWLRSPQTNATLVVEKLDRHGVTWFKTRELPYLGERVTVVTALSWKDSPDGLVLRASRLAGVMAPNRTDTFEAAARNASVDAQTLREANEVVRVAYLDGNFNGNITASAYWFALHWAQEWAGLTQWLPQVFKASRKALVDATAPADNLTAAAANASTLSAASTPDVPAAARSSAAASGASVTAVLGAALLAGLFAGRA